MTFSDQALGVIGFTAALFIWLYYTAWVILAPFVDPKVEWFHALFPDRYWAFAIPTTLLVVGLSCVGVFVGVVSLRDGKKS